MSGAYWPWWMSGLALGSLAVGYWLVLGRPMGVSGSFGRVLRFRAEREAEKRDDAFASEAELAAALREATREEFGDVPADDAAPLPAPVEVASRRPPIRGELVFLAMLVVGGALGAAARGQFALRLEMGEAFGRVVGGGVLGVLALVGGGVLVGFGTRLAGGCTSGHGLAGCARLERGSLVTTACFFGAAVVVSLALTWLARAGGASP